MLESSSFGAGIGFTWGHGTLRVSGEEFRFSQEGVTFLDFGLSKANAFGEIYNLTDIEQFNGTYIATEASFALGGGIGTTTLRNQHGVVMQLTSVLQGARLQLGSSGLTITLWRAAPSRKMDGAAA